MDLQHKAGMLGLYVEHFGSVINDVNADPQVAKCLGSIIASTPIYTDAVVRAARYGMLSWTAWNMATGALAGSAIDTNKDPSADKTILAAILGSIVGSFIAKDDYALAFGPRDIGALGKECTLYRGQMAYLQSDIAALTPAQHEELARALNLTSAQLSAFVTDLDAALAEAETGLKVGLAAVLTSMALSGYHGYKRSGVASAVGFTLMGPVGLGLGIRQGFARPLPTE